MLLTAHRLFNRYGTHRTGIDRIIKESGVAKMSFYSHFPSKRDLVFEYYQQKDFEWFELLSRHSRRSDDPREKALRLFEALEDWFGQDSFLGCPFIRGLSECDEESEPELYGYLLEHFDKTRSMISEICEPLQHEDPESICEKILALMMGAMLAAQTSKSPDPAIRAREMAYQLLIAA